MNTQEYFEEYCVNHTGLCLVAFLPHIKDQGEEKRKLVLKELDDLRKKHLSKNLTFLWAQGGDNFDLEERLSLGFGFPALIAMNYSKGKFSTMRKSFTK